MLRRLVRLYPMFLIGLAFGAAGLLAIVASGRTDVGARDALASLWSNLFFLPYLARDQVRDATGGLISSPIFPANPPAGLVFRDGRKRGPVLAYPPEGPNPCNARCDRMDRLCHRGFWVGLDGHKTGFNPSIGWSLDSFFGGFFRVTYGFALGMLIHRWRAPIAQALCSRLPRWLLNPWVIYAIALAALVNPFAARGVLTAPTLLVVMPMLMALGTMCRPAGAGVTTVSLLLGSLSYPLYCLHYPIGRLLGSPGRNWRPITRPSPASQPQSRSPPPILRPNSLMSRRKEQSPACALHEQRTSRVSQVRSTGFPARSRHGWARPNSQDRARR